MSNIKELAKQSAEALLDSMGFDRTVTVREEADLICVDIESSDASYIIGDDGSRLDDVQYLINRMIQKECPDAERVKVDCDSYRERTEARLLEKAVKLANKVLETGKPLRLNPLNAYHRRLVHNKLQEIQGILTESEEGSARYKRITIKKQN